MRGRSGCPTGQEKNSVGATGESRSDFLQGKVGYRVAPSSDPASPAHLWFMVASPGPDRTVPRTVRPPRGRLWGWEGPFPSANPPLPARPAGGRAVTGVGQMGRRPGRIKKDHLSSSKNQREVGPGRREPLSALVFFPPAFFQRKPGSRPESGGKPRRRARPAPVQTWTTCRYRDPQDKKEEPQWKSNNSS